MKDLKMLESYRDTEKERELYGHCGDNGNGIFKIFIQRKSFWCIASNGGGWEHVSVSRPNGKIPTWEEMCEIKSVFFGEDETVVQYHPKKSEYVNFHKSCLHLWKPITEKMPTPPMIFV